MEWRSVVAAAGQQKQTEKMAKGSESSGDIGKSSGREHLFCLRQLRRKEDAFFLQSLNGPAAGIEFHRQRHQLKDKDCAEGDV